MTQSKTSIEHGGGLAGTSRCAIPARADAAGTTAHPPSSIRHSPFYNAFSLIEILITVALLSVIILGLVAMFSQTRRAFTSSMTQVDVMESGRSAADFIAREMEQLAASGNTNAVNFYASTSPAFIPAMAGWPLMIPADMRTNNLEQVYFLTRYSQQWNITGYRIFTEANGIGTLYRFASNNIALTNLAALVNSIFFFTNNAATPTNGYFTPLVNGVVDFRVRAYQTNGSEFLPLQSKTAAPFIPPVYYLVQSNRVLGDYSYQFAGNTLPAYVEVELGIIEDRTLARYSALTNGPAGAAFGYLTNHAAQVHIFRQRVTIPNVNPAAF